MRRSDGSVLENSTACVYVERLVRLRSEQLINNPVGFSFGRTDFEHKLKVTELAGMSGRHFFTESLILAQDERWRRA